MRWWGILALATALAGCSDDGSNDDASGSDGGTDGSATATASASATATATATDTAGSTSGGSSSSDGSAGTTGTTTDGSSSGDASTGSDGSTDTGGSTGTGDSTDTAGSEESSSSGGTMVIDDPFDPASCQGMPFTLADAEAALGGMDRVTLATATIQVRERTCPGGTCGDWGEAFDWVINYLTWSGGVVTAYKEFQADMQLVVFDDQGTTRLSLQHVTFDLPSSTYDDGDGMLYDLPPEPIGFPHVRAYDDDPDFEYYYQELDWLVRDGVLTVGEDCVRWVADPYIQQPPFTEQYAVVFHW